MAISNGRNRSLPIIIKRASGTPLSPTLVEASAGAIPISDRDDGGASSHAPVESWVIGKAFRASPSDQATCPVIRCSGFRPTRNWVLLTGVEYRISPRIVSSPTWSCTKVPGARLVATISPTPLFEMSTTCTGHSSARWGLNRRSRPVEWFGERGGKRWSSL